MGTAKLVSVVATGPGIIMMNGRTGQVAKGMSLEVDPETAAQYDFLKVVERPKHAAEEKAKAEEVPAEPKPPEEKTTAPKGRSKSSATRKRKTARKAASKNTPPADSTGEAPIP